MLKCSIAVEIRLNAELLNIWLCQSHKKLRSKESAKIGIVLDLCFKESLKFVRDKKV